MDDSKKGDVAKAVAAANTYKPSGSSTTTTTSTTSSGRTGGSTTPPNSSSAGSYSGTSPQASANKTAMQERVENAANYHEPPTREQHHAEYGEQVEFWNNPAIARQVDANEREADKKYNQSNFHPDHING